MNELILFEHNQSTYEKVKALWQKSRDVAVVQATGTGKSYLIARILKDFNNQRKLVIAPSKYILHQLQDQFGFDDSYTVYLTYSKTMRLSQPEIAELNPYLPKILKSKISSGI